MRVQRNDQLAGRDARPDAAIDSIVRPYHPAQIQIHTLAGTALRRSRKEESDGNPSVQLTSWIQLFVTETQQYGRKVLQRNRGVLIGPSQTGCKSGLDRAVILQHPADDPEENRKIPAGVKQVVETTQATAVRPRVEIGDRFCGCRTK